MEDSDGQYFHQYQQYEQRSKFIDHKKDQDIRQWKSWFCLGNGTQMWPLIGIQTPSNWISNNKHKKISIKNRTNWLPLKNTSHKNERKHRKCKSHIKVNEMMKLSKNGGLSPYNYCIACIKPRMWSVMYINTYLSWTLNKQESCIYPPSLK